VVAEVLNFYLLQELVDHVVGLDDGFAYFLQCEDGFGLFMDGLVD
jgi:hypothetical protein